MAHVNKVVVSADATDTDTIDVLSQTRDMLYGQISELHSTNKLEKPLGNEPMGQSSNTGNNTFAQARDNSEVCSLCSELTREGSLHT